jgi:exportin-7
MDQEQLLRVEAMCTALYQGQSASQRVEAQKQLITLQSSAEFIPQCQFILDNSTQPYAQLVASASLENLITQFWNNFTLSQKLEIRNYVLNYLATKAHILDDFVLGNLAKLTCRITKLGWFDSAEHRDIIEETSKFLQATIDHHIVGLKLLNALVDEMNTPTLGKIIQIILLAYHSTYSFNFMDE